MQLAPYHLSTSLPTYLSASLPHFTPTSIDNSSDLACLSERFQPCRENSIDCLHHNAINCILIIAGMYSILIPSFPSEYLSSLATLEKAVPGQVTTRVTHKRSWVPCSVGCFGLLLAIAGIFHLTVPSRSRIIFDPLHLASSPVTLLLPLHHLPLINLNLNFNLNILILDHQVF